MRRTLVFCLLVILLLSTACHPSPEEAPATTEHPQSADVPEPAATAPKAIPEPATEAKAPEQPVQEEAEAEQAASEATESESRFAPLYAQMQEKVALPDMMALPVDMVVDFYGIDPADCKDGLYYISYDNLLADEIVLVEAVDAPAAERIEKALIARLAAKAVEADDYAPDQYAIIKKCDVVKKDLTVAMLVSPEAKTLTALFEAFL